MGNSCTKSRFASRHHYHFSHRAGVHQESPGRSFRSDAVPTANYRASGRGVPKRGPHQRVGSAATKHSDCTRASRFDCRRKAPARVVFLRRRDDPIGNFPGDCRVVDSGAINLSKQIRNSESGEEVGKTWLPQSMSSAESKGCKGAKVTGQSPSSRVNARNLRKISPLGQNDNSSFFARLAPWREKIS